MASVEIENILTIVPRLLRVPFKHMWYDYDEKADVLYLSFKKPLQADDSELTDDDLIVRYEKGTMVGITILHASQRKEPKA